MINLNWIYERGLKVIGKEDAEEPLLILPMDIFNQLQNDVEREKKR